MKRGKFFAAVMIIGWVMLSSISFGYSGGDGTAGNPFQISNKADLLTLSATSADWNKCFILTADINLAGENFTTALIAPDTDSSTDLFQGTQYQGVFDGRSHIVYNLTLNASTKDYIGFFGSISSGGQVKNIKIENVNITGRYFVGGLAGENLGTINNCHVTGSISATSFVGGLVGYNSSRITTSYARCSINDAANGIGGLVGYNAGVIDTCYAMGSVSGIGRTGGLVGYNDMGFIGFCYATDSVTGTESSIGGLVGETNKGNLIANFWDIQASGTSDGVGIINPDPVGVTGKTTVQMKDIQVYLRANWMFIYGTVTYGNWIMQEDSYPELVCQIYPQVLIPNTKGLQPEQAEAVLDAAGIVSGDNEFVYDVSVADALISETFPKSGTMVYGGLTRVHLLIAKGTKYSGGNGNTLPYQIANLGNLLDVTSTPADWGSSFVLTADIDLGGLPFPQSPIAPDTSGSSGFQGTKFTGIFDGNGHVISNLTIAASTQDCTGLFGCVGSSGQIKKIGMENVNITGHACVGGLIGLSDSNATTTLCYAKGLRIGYSYIGGLIGYNSGAITSSYAMGIVNGSYFAGGLLGKNYRGQMLYCYSTGHTTGGASVGGLCGSVTTGTGYQDIGNFWDKESAAISTSTMGIGKTTSQMQTLSTYTVAGWDFADIWAICEGTNYPRLQWQIPAGDFACPEGVSVEDLDYFVGRWLLENCTSSNNFCGGVDINASGKVDLADWAVFAGSWLE